MKRFAFYGRVSTEDQQDPASSRSWQLARSRQVIEQAGGEIVERGRKLGKEVVLHTHFNHPNEATGFSQDAARVKFAQCMRDNGVDYPDPDFSGGGGVISIGPGGGPAHVGLFARNETIGRR